MPILWRYLLSQFIKMALTCVGAFVAILLTVRLDEVAHFIALGAPISYVALFISYQIPYILPIAIPISCLIASFLLIQQLSLTHELIALRASGFALRHIVAPILLVSAFLSVLNFWIVSEVATQTHLTSNMLKAELRSINPLMLLNNKHLMRLKGVYFEARGPSRVGETASDVVLAIPNKQTNRIGLLTAKQLVKLPDSFEANHLTLISSSEEDQLDNLYIENIGHSVTPTQDFADLLQNKVWTLSNDHLRLTLLRARKEHLLNQLGVEPHHDQIRSIKRQLDGIYSEIARRFSLGIAVFSFTLLGLACGMSIGRQRSYKGLGIAIAIAVLYLSAFFAAKGAAGHWIFVSSLYLFPLLLMIVTSSWMLQKIAKGKG